MKEILTVNPGECVVCGKEAIHLFRGDWLCDHCYGCGLTSTLTERNKKDLKYENQPK